MQKLYFMVAILFLCHTSLLYAQSYYEQQSFEKKSMVDVHAGYLDPRDTDMGMLFGAALISTFDNAIDIGFGFDLFQKNYAEETEVSTGMSGDTQTTIVATKIDYKRTVIPLYASLKIKIPGLISRRNNKTIFGYFGRASLSYQFLISDEQNYEANKSEKRNYQGWGWQGGGGIFYNVGARSTLIAEAIYNNCTVHRNVTTQTDLLPQTERVDLSGVGFTLGLELDIT